MTFTRSILYRRAPLATHQAATTSAQEVGGLGRGWGRGWVAVNIGDRLVLMPVKMDVFHFTPPEYGSCLDFLLYCAAC